jgi:hypothetical protein
MIAVLVPAAIVVIIAVVLTVTVAVCPGSARQCHAHGKE